MRLLLVNAHGADRASGGAEKYVFDLLSGFERRGWSVSVLSAFPARVDGLTGQRAFVLHETDWRDNNRRRLKNHAGDLLAQPSQRLRDVVGAVKPDLVHTNNLPGITTAIWEVCGRLAIPVVHTIHDYYLLCPRVTLARRDGTSCCAHPGFCKARTARLLRWSTRVGAVIAVSDHVRRRHQHLFPGIPSEVVRIPTSPVSQVALDPPRTPPKTVAYLGALERTKGVEHLLEAAIELKILGYGVQVAGDGRLRQLVEAAARRGDIRYHGTVHGSDKLRFIESADFAVLPSIWEEPGGPPYSAAEWLAEGRPVIASRRGGLTELPQVSGGVMAMNTGAAGIVGAVWQLAHRWEELLAALPEPDEQATDHWLDRHQEVYELARRRRNGDEPRRTSVR